MKSHLMRLAIGLQRSSLFTTALRTRLLRSLDFDVDSTAVVQQDVFFGDRRQVRLAAHSFVGIGSFFDGNAMITVGERARIGPYVRLLTGTHPIADDVVRIDPAEPNIQRPIVIGRGAWVGLNSIVMPGVTIAEGCVIGAGSVVTADTMPNGLYMGVPARRCRDLPVGPPSTAPVSRDREIFTGTARTRRYATANSYAVPAAAQAAKMSKPAVVLARKRRKAHSAD